MRSASACATAACGTHSLRLFSGARWAPSSALVSSLWPARRSPPCQGWRPRCAQRARVAKRPLPPPPPSPPSVVVMPSRRVAVMRSRVVPACAASRPEAWLVARSRRPRCADPVSPRAPDGLGPPPKPVSLVRELGHTARASVPLHAQCAPRRQRVQDRCPFPPPPSIRHVLHGPVGLRDGGLHASVSDAGGLCPPRRARVGPAAKA